MGNRPGYYEEHQEMWRTARKKWKDNNPEKVREYGRNRAAAIKVEVLTFYGNGALKCTWDGCIVTDPDMLSLDHVNNDGSVERRQNKHQGGHTLYRRLRARDFPPGFQTLCHNHQWKKEMMRRRGDYSRVEEKPHARTDDTL